MTVRIDRPINKQCDWTVVVLFQTADRRCVKQNVNDFYCDIAMLPSPERIPRPRSALTIDAVLLCIC